MEAGEECSERGPTWAMRSRGAPSPTFLRRKQIGRSPSASEQGCSMADQETLPKVRVKLKAVGVAP